jgi:hypothetical protein
VATEAVGGRIVELDRAADLLDAAGVQHRHAVGGRVRLLLVVRHVDRGDAELALQVLQLRAHLDAQLGVEVGERLVEQEHIRLDHQRARERDALLLTAGELRRPPIGKRSEPDQLEDSAHPARHLGTRNLPALQAEGDIAGDGHVRPQRIALEHHADVARPGRKLGDVAPTDQDASGRRRAEAGDQAQQRGLAGTGRPQEGEELARRDGERHVVEHRRRVVGEADVIDHDLARHQNTSRDLRPRSRSAMR